MITINIPKGQSFQSYLRELGACRAALDWVGKKTFRQAWSTCTVIHWMLWFLYQTNLQYCTEVATNCIQAYLDDIPDVPNDMREVLLEALRRYRVGDPAAQQYAEKYRKVYGWPGRDLGTGLNGIWHAVTILNYSPAIALEYLWDKNDLILEIVRKSIAFDPPKSKIRRKKA